MIHAFFICCNSLNYIPPIRTKLPKTTIITAIPVTKTIKPYKMGLGSFFNFGKMNFVAEIARINVLMNSSSFILTIRSIPPLN